MITTDLISSPKNVRERPKQSMDTVDAIMPLNITGFRPIRSESRLKGSVVKVFVTERNDPFR